MSDTTRSLLAEREKTHGCFSDVAEVAQAIKAAFYDPVESGTGIDLNDVQHEALECIAVKMARIVCGDPKHVDHWVDIAGYAQLVVDHLGMEKIAPADDDFRPRTDDRDDRVERPEPPAMRDVPVHTCKACGAPDGTHYGACPLKPAA